MDARDAIVFETRYVVPTLGDDEVHVWFVTAIGERPPAVAAEARAILEQLLCAYASRARVPTIERGAHGKPFAPELPDLHFNLSHAGRYVLLGFARAQPLGIDLECCDRRISFDDIARRFFASAEADALERLAPALREPAFLRLWTNKEAVLKALGEGLNFGLDRVEFGVNEQGAIGALRRIPFVAGMPSDWTLHRLQPVEGFIGALAWQGPPRRIRAFALPLGLQLQRWSPLARP